MQEVEDGYRDEYLPGLRPILDDPDHQPVRHVRFSVTSRGQMVIAPEFTPRA